MSDDRLRVLELYCGIGGVAAALGGTAEVVAAVDIDRQALAVYAANFAHPAHARNLDAAAAAAFAALGADLWTLSPPCQPYTRRGRGRDLDDPRAASLPPLLDALAAAPPPYLFLESVPGFAGSRAHARLRAVLDGAGYRVVERLLCPSQWGMPNRRRRFYLVAGRAGAAPLGPVAAPPARPRGLVLAELLDAAPAPELAVPGRLARAYRHALDVVDPADPAARTACFTAAYGRSPVRSGSYLVTAPPAAPGDPPSLRRFSPREILRLLGFPEGLPPAPGPAAPHRLAPGRQQPGARPGAGDAGRRARPRNAPRPRRLRSSGGGGLRYHSPHTAAMPRIYQRRHSQPGTSPGTLHAPKEQRVDRVRIHVLRYGPDHLEEHEVTAAEELAVLRPEPGRLEASSAGVTWVDVVGLHDVELLAEIGRIFGLHPLALEDVVNVGQRPKVEEYRDHLFLVLREFHTRVGSSPPSSSPCSSSPASC